MVSHQHTVLPQCFKSLFKLSLASDYFKCTFTHHSALLVKYWRNLNLITTARLCTSKLQLLVHIPIPSLWNPIIKLTTKLRITGLLLMETTWLVTFVHRVTATVKRLMDFVGVHHHAVIGDNLNSMTSDICPVVPNRIGLLSFTAPSKTYKHKWTPYYFSGMDFNVYCWYWICDLVNGHVTWWPLRQWCD